jgi:hypothetical protein
VAVPARVPAVAVVARPSEPDPAAPPAPPLTLEAAWTVLLDALPGAERASVHAVTFPVSLAEGTLKVGVRKELWRARVRDLLGGVDLVALVPGARRVEVVVEGEAGTTGREAYADAELRRRTAARAAAEASEALQRVLVAFGAELDEVVPSSLEAAAEPAAPAED